MPAYMWAVAVLVGIGSGQQTPQSFESDPWQAPVVQQTTNVIAFTPPDQGDMAWLDDENGYISRIVWPNAYTMQVVWDDGNAVAAPLVDDSYSPLVHWADANTPPPLSDDGALPIAAGISLDNEYFVPRVIWPSWNPALVVYDNGELARLATGVQAALRLSDLGDYRYLVSDQGEPVLALWDAQTERFIAWDASANRLLVWDASGHRLWVGDV